MVIKKKTIVVWIKKVKNKFILENVNLIFNN